MQTMLTLLALPVLGLGMAPSAAAAAPAPFAVTEADPTTDGVLMSWTLGEGSMELVREDNTLSIVAKATDGTEIKKQRVNVLRDDAKLVYLPADGGGLFYIVKSDGSLEQHNAEGEIGFGGATPELVEVREDQQKVLDSIAPASPDAEPSWNDVINSLGGSSGATKQAGAATEAAEAVDPTRLEITEREDGTKLINDQFVLAGEGTKDKPYEVTWDYFTSVRTTYQPREGKKDIPAHIKLLEGKYVRIGGYLQFPLATPEPKELLVMLNQWDGCCIGIPPTPYDAIEVSLTTPATRGEKFAVEGSLVGQLKIDPYLVGDWLIGLYLLGDAGLDVSGSRSAQEVYGNSPTVGDPNAMPGR